MKKKICFVIMGFGEKKDPKTRKMIDLDEAYKKIIKPVVEDVGCKCIRADELTDTGLIDKSMYALLYSADIVIADITTLNPNAIYELGARHILKKHSTVVFCEKDTPNPFDINHNRRFCYSKSGKELTEKEISEGKKTLKDVLTYILNSRKRSTDSPLYNFFPDCTPPSISEIEKGNIIEDLMNVENNIYGLTEKARSLEKNENFEAAANLWHKLAENTNNDLYYIQREALCTYKKNEKNSDNLREALSILKKIQNPNDYETLGLFGAIYKRMYNLDNQPETLDKAIEAYHKGWILTGHYYPGENYANCIDLKRNLIDNEDIKAWCKVESENTRKKLITQISSELNNEDVEDKMWKCATLSNCYRALSDNENAKKYENLFLSEQPTEDQIETFNQTKNQILIY